MGYSLDVCGANDKARIVFFEIMGDVKAPVSVGITSKINNVIFFHGIDYRLFKSLKAIDSDNPTEPTAADFENVVTTLQNADADFISDVIEGENRFGTGPVRDSYFCMASTRLIPRLQAIKGFIAKAQYPSQMNILSAEWGSVNNVRLVLSSRGSSTSSASLLGADIYNMFITGQEAYSSVELDGESAKFIYHPPGWGDDPCELRSTGGYRFSHARAITNNSWIINLRATL